VPASLLAMSLQTKRCRLYAWTMEDPEQYRKTMTSRDIHDTTTKYKQELPPSKDIAALRFKYLDTLDRDIRESTTNGPVALATVIEQA
jgi:hypothetical protein